MGPPEEQVWPAQTRPSGPPARPPTPPNVRSFPPAATHPAQMIEAIDWAVAENARQGSPYFNRIDTSKVAVMGMSCGGIQAIEAGADPRVTTTVVWNSGLFADASGLNASAGGKALTKADLDRLHGSVAYISGDVNDIAFKNANDDFAYLKRIPAFRAYRKNTVHDGTYGEIGGGEFAQVGLAWLNWRLKGDAEAARMFSGADCGLCRNPDWVVAKKNHP
jgi:dienelactone hydrolase